MNREEKLTSVKHVFILGSKGIPAKYGGFESFVEKLTRYQKSSNIQYYVSCLTESSECNNKKKVFKYNNACCFNVNTLNIGSAKAILYDLSALNRCIKYIKDKNIQNPIIYILACRIGPFIGFYIRKLKKLGVTLYVNPDGHEWKRAKWNAFIRKYWKESERLMIKHADLIICDSINIEKYIQSEYKNYNPKTTYISYGAEIKQKSKYISEKLNQWYKSFGIKQDNYYLSVGRFVPENNFETMIKEFMRSHSFKDYIIITNIDNEKYYKKLLANTQFMTDSRIKFVGSVYDQELLSEIRNNAYAYIHGHEVGGTNPSLLEALGSTKVNLLYNVDFNNEVAEDSAYYWTKSSGDLSDLINKIDKLTLDERNDLGRNANLQIEKRYNWNSVVDQYENVFLNGI